MYRNVRFAAVLALFLVFDHGSLLSQDHCLDLSKAERKTLAKKAMDGLNSSAVVAIRLQGFKKQIEKIDHLIEASSDPKVREKLTKKRTIYLEEPKLWQKALKSAFDEHYKLSEVVFYYDYDQDKVKSDDAKIWLNDDGQFERRPDSKKVAFYLVQGTTPMKGLEAFMLRDSEFKEVCAPLPGYFKLNKLSSFFLYGEKERAKKAEKLAKSFQSDMQTLRAIL